MQPGELLVAPVRHVLLADEHERDVEAVVLVQLAGVLDDDPDAARELQVVDEEADPHVSVPAGSWSRAAAPLGGSPRRPSSSWM